MKTFNCCHVAVIVASLALSSLTIVTAQQRTVGLLVNDSRAAAGYTLFAPMIWNVVYLIDNDGRVVHSWKCDSYPGLSVYLEKNGNLLHNSSLKEPGNPSFDLNGVGGIVQEYSWDGTLLWNYEYSNEWHLAHHDAIALPNGNILLIAWERKMLEDAIMMGKNPADFPQGMVFPDEIVEVRKTGPTSGEIVWEWHAWDHLVQEFDPSKMNYGRVAEHPELIDVNYPPELRDADWMHSNSLSYNETFDQILLSVRNFNEVWVIDHSTTSEEAASHTGGRSGRGGDILYRWGNPAAYGAGTIEQQQIGGQHDAHWIEPGLPGEGDILLFDNYSKDITGPHSSIIQITPPVDANGTYIYPPSRVFGPDAPTWSFTAQPPTSLFAGGLSGADRMANGNTLICVGQTGTFLEVTPAGEVVWKYVNPVTYTGIMTQGDQVPGGPAGGMNSVFKIRRYPPDYPGLLGRDLTPGAPIEKYRTDATDGESAHPGRVALYQNYPNPASGRTSLQFDIPEDGPVLIRVYDAVGRLVAEPVHAYLRAGRHAAAVDVGTFARGVYTCTLQAQGALVSRSMIVADL